MPTSAEVADDLRQRIALGEFDVSGQLPSVRELREQYGLRSQGRLDAALKTLEAAGLVTIAHGRGIFLRKYTVVTRDLLGGIREEHRRAHAGMLDEPLFEALTGVERATVVVSYERLSEAPRHMVNRLSQVKTTMMPSQKTAEWIERTHTWFTGHKAYLRRSFLWLIGDDEPHQLTTSYMEPSLAAAAGMFGPEIEQPGLTTMALLLRAGVDVTIGHLALFSRNPTPEEARTLKIPPGTPVFEHLRTYVAGPDVVEVAQAIVPAHLVVYTFDIDLTEDR